MQHTASVRTMCKHSRANRSVIQTGQATSQVSRDIAQLLDQTKQRELRLRRLAAEADQQLPRLIKRLNGLASIGLLSKDILIGPIVMMRSDGMELADEGDTIVQAALTTHMGPAALFWSGDEFSDPGMFPSLEAEALDRAMPLRHCSIAVRGLVWPEVPALLKQALNRVSYLRVVDGSN